MSPLDWWKKLPYVNARESGARVFGVRPGKRQWLWFVVDPEGEYHGTEAAAQDARNRAAERLVFALRIYPNYRVDSRGPLGCIYDALEVLAPDVVERLRNGEDVGDVHESMWPDR